MAETDLVVETRSLTKVYRDFWGRKKKTALNALDLKIHKGEIFGLRILGWGSGGARGRASDPHPSPLPEGEGEPPSPDRVREAACPLSLWERVRVRDLTDPSPPRLP